MLGLKIVDKRYKYAENDKENPQGRAPVLPPHLENKKASGVDLQYDALVGG